LLLLLALANVVKGGDRWITYEDLEAKLAQLLVDFAPPTKQHHPEYPFWRLKKDKIWCVGADHALPENRGGDLSPIVLRKNTPMGLR